MAPPRLSLPRRAAPPPLPSSLAPAHPSTQWAMAPHPPSSRQALSPPPQAQVACTRAPLPSSPWAPEWLSSSASLVFFSDPSTSQNSLQYNFFVVGTFDSLTAGQNPTRARSCVRVLKLSAGERKGNTISSTDEQRWAEFLIYEIMDVNDGSAF